MNEEVLLPADLNAAPGEVFVRRRRSRGPGWGALAWVLLGLAGILWIEGRLVKTPLPALPPMPRVTEPVPAREVPEEAIPLLREERETASAAEIPKATADDKAEDQSAALAELERDSPVPRPPPEDVRLMPLRLERIPVPVRFTSDAETDVTLLRVKHLGSFVERTEVLLPGDYVAVGTRLGYRDRRISFTVKAGSEGLDVDVRVVEGL